MVTAFGRMMGSVILICEMWTMMNRPAESGTGRMWGMKLYLIVTRDEYELPIIVGDSVAWIAEKMGVKPESLYTCFSKAKNPHCKEYKSYSKRYLTVEVEDDG